MAHMAQATNIHFNLPVSFIKEGKQVVAYTPALDISTVGKDEAQVKERFAELVNMFFADIIETNSADDVLSELGWKKVAGSWNPPIVSNESINVSVPAFA
jgi:hypothetical protein